MLKQRIITASILFVLFLMALFGLPTLGWQGLVLIVMWQGAVEWARLSGLTGRAATGYWALTLVLMLSILLFDNNVTMPQQNMLHLVWYSLAVLLWIVVVPVWLIAGWRTQNIWLMGMTGWAVLIPTGLAMLDLRQDSDISHPLWLLGMMSLVWMADIAAYFAGRRFGKNKLAPSISPGKTWEGVIGAMLGVSICIVLAWSFSMYSTQIILLPTLLLAAWCWVGLAVMGDLFESAIKRQAGVKDSGALFPGHGGLLDRIDALTSTLPFAGIALILQRLG